MFKTLTILLVTAFMLSSVSACGVKNEPVAPETVDPDYPRPYPAPAPIPGR